MTRIDMQTIRKGSRGEDVKRLQEILRLLPDGLFGPLTEEAVLQYQRERGLAADGVVGPRTWELLLAGAAAGLKKSSRKISEIILHCTATREGADATVDDIRRWHTAPAAKGGRGWSDIGYHYVVYRDGSVHEGRDVDVSGAHCLGHNCKSIGVVYVGGLDSKGAAKDTRTDAQKAALAELVEGLKKLYGLGKGSVYGHCEFANKACPCFDVEKEFRS